ncbi:hypothetical protein JCM21714_3752 [Gracilibacillus boraciitolerans JCM 21714]|uniref:Peptidase C39-like domain-containing protein n=1 Tax=Gracilibacillus boraciitolerans JCM 21714 TaxID=1298598 RepID=W4VN66_9BACI|nr:hypothetical protein JCM21714_3752 [Gracilibacillus boraciitolerans JCM 21714]
MTGNPFESVIKTITNGKPVVALTNITFKPLEEKEFATWHTPNGPIEVTKKLHAVLITGFDKQSIFFNDPYDGTRKKNFQGRVCGC